MVSFSRKMNNEELCPDDEGWFNIDRQNAFRLFNCYSSKSGKGSDPQRTDIIIYDDGSENRQEFLIKGNFILVIRRLAQHLINSIEDQKKVISYIERTEVSLPKLKVQCQPKDFFKPVMWEAGTAKPIQYKPNVGKYPHIIAFSQFEIDLER